ncbi:MAG: type II toxin-antitoxin system RelB/DinJ family antitoxin [Bacilli bacterium]|nr:type II toxin-antitoxin system RelB/DinJ family antitoxin [Bacilli bacterium]
MKKTEIIHTRVTPETKRKCDEIFNKLGITTSYAITLFLNQVMLRKGLPFDLTLPEKEDLVAFAINVNSIDGKVPSEKAQQIMHLYDDGLIDLETAESAIRKLHISK